MYRTLHTRARTHTHTQMKIHTYIRTSLAYLKLPSVLTSIVQNDILDFEYTLQKPMLQRSKHIDTYTHAYIHTYIHTYILELL